MTFFRFNDDDIINTVIVTHPRTVTKRIDNSITGSVRLEKQFLNNDLEQRIYDGFSEKKGGRTSLTGPFTASIDLFQAVSGGTNSLHWHAVNQLYNFYDFFDSDYTINFTGSKSTTIKIIDIPQVYYDKQILSGTFSASDHDASGDLREIFDNGRGGLYSGSMTGTLVGNIFYDEGIAVLKDGDLANFGEIGTALSWSFDFRGVHRIPANIFKCRAPSGQVNASTNPTFYKIAQSGAFKNQREIVHTGSVYITKVGLYNMNYELVAVCNISQPIRKDLETDVLFRLVLDR